MIDFIKEGITWSEVDLVRNEVQHIVNAPDPELYPDRSGLKYYLDLDVPEFPMSDVYDTMIRLEGREKPPVTSSGSLIYEGCEFRLEELLAGQLSITKPVRQGALLSAVVSLTSKYRVREIIQPALRDQVMPARVAMRAGLAQRDFVAYEHSFFTKYQEQKRQFLTWDPNNKPVSWKQPEFIYFLLNFSPMPERINLRVRVTKADGTREVLTKAYIEDLLKYQVLCCAVGPAVLELDPDVIKYEVWLSYGDNERFSEVRTYVIDQRTHAFERFLLFSNSFGAFDTIRVTGMASQETDVVRNVSRKERPTGADLDFSELEIISVSENSGLKVSTGFFEENAGTYADYLRELMIAEVILMETEYGFEAMNLVTSNLEYAKDRPGLIERTFELSRTYSDKNYSRMPAAVKVPARPTRWAGIAAKAVLNAYGKRTGYITYQRLQKVYEDDGTKVIPYVITPNVPGNPDYIPPYLEASIVPGSTPYPSGIITRSSTFLRNNCGAGFLGTAPVITIAAGTYGGELPGAADELAEAAWQALNTQAYANTHGSCAVNTTPIHFAILNKIPTGPGNVVIAHPEYYAPVPDLRANGVVVIPNTTGEDPPESRLSELTYSPGIYDLVIQISYGTTPFYPCKIKIPSKGLELSCAASGFYIFSGVQVNSTDEPLTVEIVAI